MIYRTGYHRWKSQDRLVAQVEALEATLVDIRFSPKSHHPQWSGVSLNKRLGDRYVHIKALGNVNYRGGPVHLLDADAGIAELLAISGDSVLLCACWNPMTCHRMTVGDILHSLGIASEELDARIMEGKVEQMPIL